MKISKMKLGMAMAKNGLNFKALSEASGVSRATLSYLNNGKTCNPSVLFKIANALNVEPQELIEIEREVI